MLKSIYKTIDEYGAIEVLDNGAKRFLTFGNEHEQSCQIKAQPHVPQHEYSRAIMLSLLFTQPNRIGILGLGGGTTACAFLHACPSAEILAVELRQDVIKIAQKYFQVPKHEPRLHLIHQDAFTFLKDDVTLFDILVADLYHHHGIDELQLQKQFIEDCAMKLSDNGWLILNYWLDHDLNKDILQEIYSHFACVYFCNSGGGNIILYASRKYPNGDFSLPGYVKPLAKTLGFSLNYYLKRLVLLAPE